MKFNTKVFNIKLETLRRI